MILNRCEKCAPLWASGLRLGCSLCELEKDAAAAGTLKRALFHHPWDHSYHEHLCDVHAPLFGQTAPIFDSDQTLPDCRSCGPYLRVGKTWDDDKFCSICECSRDLSLIDFRYHREKRHDPRKLCPGHREDIARIEATEPLLKKRALAEDEQFSVSSTH